MYYTHPLIYYTQYYFWVHTTSKESNSRFTLPLCMYVSFFLFLRQFGCPCANAHSAFHFRWGYLIYIMRPRFSLANWITLTQQIKINADQQRYKHTNPCELLKTGCSLVLAMIKEHLWPDPDNNLHCSTVLPMMSLYTYEWITVQWEVQSERETINISCHSHK